MNHGAWLCFLLSATACSAVPPARTPEAPPYEIAPLAAPAPHEPPPPPSEEPPWDPSIRLSPILLDVKLSLGGAPITHTLPSEQTVNTPVPIYFEPPPGLVVEEAKLRYRPFGAIRYQAQIMKKLGAGFAGLISCGDVSTTGDLRFYITLADGNGETLDSIGSRAEPLRVQIKNELEGDPPSLPGQRPPVQCRTPGCYFPELDAQKPGP